MSYEIASAKLHDRPVSTYIDAQLEQIRETLTQFFRAKGHFPPYDQRQKDEYHDMLMDLIKSQKIFVPFDLRVLKLVYVFMEHEVTTPSSKQRMPRRLPKPLPANRHFDSLVPSWYSNFIKSKVIGNDLSRPLGDMQEVLSCASFMGVEGLVKLISGKIASMMQECRSLDGMRQLFGIECDFTPEIQQKLVAG